ncbi:hypothetical protein WMF18_11285 [Sorangium sp. So ce315]|uniref:hypothetical protein n=1 Tax=Sorangium sp. So ce315 TaxID=3133299 RepID=UPI003F629339
MRTSTLPAVALALLTSLAGCTGNGPRGPSTEPAPSEPPGSPAAPAPTTQAPTVQAPTTQAPAASGPTTPAPAASGPTTPAQATTPAQGDEALLGAWRSAACGSRKYERVLSFAKDGSFTAEDRVSPCPPRVACIWSGIIHRKGAFKRSGDTVALSVAEASQGPAGQPFPTTLVVDAAGAPAEAGEDGKPCPYQR